MTNSKDKIIKTVYLTPEHRRMVKLLCIKNNLSVEAIFDEALNELIKYYESHSLFSDFYFHDEHSTINNSTRFSVKVKPEYKEKLKLLSQSLNKKEYNLVFESMELILKKYNVRYSEIVPLAKKRFEKTAMSPFNYSLREDQLQPLKILSFTLQRTESNLLSEAVHLILEKYNVLEYLNSLKPLELKLLELKDDTYKPIKNSPQIKKFTLVDKELLKPFKFLFIQLERTSDNVVQEALDDLFEKYKNKVNYLDGDIKDM